MSATILECIPQLEAPLVQHPEDQRVVSSLSSPIRQAPRARARASSVAALQKRKVGESTSTSSASRLSDEGTSTSSTSRPNDMNRGKDAAFSVESVLVVWKEFVPQGFTIEERLLPWLVPVVARRLLRAAPPSKELAELFSSSAAAPCTFQLLLKVHDGRVHFLNFWKAFDEAAIVADLYPHDGVTAELTILRDDLLRSLDEEARKADQHGASAVDGIVAEAVVYELHRAAAMSARPLFWRAAAEQLCRQDREWLSRDELTALMVDWLHEAKMWQDLGIGGVATQAPSSSSAAPNAEAAQPPSLISMISSATSWTWLVHQDDEQGIPVRLNIYDVASDDSIKTLNRILAHESAPVRFGGVFHAGVEVNGLEWSFGYSNSCNKPGVSCISPQSNKQHSFRETVECGRTLKTPDEIGEIISGLLEEYPGHDYDLLRRNCCHFADEFCRRLGVDGIPSWLQRLARLGAGVETVVRAAYSVKEHLYGEDVTRDYVASPPPTRSRHRRRERQQQKASRVATEGLIETPPPRDRLTAQALRSSERIAAAEANERTAERSRMPPAAGAQQSGDWNWSQAWARDWGLRVV